jgi:hypothetical protein
LSALPDIERLNIESGRAEIDDDGFHTLERHEYVLMLMLNSYSYHPLPVVFDSAQGAK